MTTVVAAHQTNLLPGASVVNKVMASDVVIWLDAVQFSPGGFTNRNRLPDGSWLTVPVRSGAGSLPIREVRIAEGDWRRSFVRSIRQSYPRAIWLDAVCEIVERPHGLLVGLNVALLQLVFGRVPLWQFQSHLDSGGAVPVVSESAEELRPISERLAMMVEEVGGDVYLSGESGRKYLDERPFRGRGIAVEYWRHEGPNPCALDLLNEIIGFGWRPPRGATGIVSAGAA